MELHFSKYSGCGNDFILIDDRAHFFPCSSKNLIARLCHRQKGVGADGIILMQSSQKAACKMRIFNADGSEAEMCGNGLRCLVRFAYDLGIKASTVESMCSVHRTELQRTSISIEMSEPSAIEWNIDLGLEERLPAIHSINTGVPHAILFVKDCEALDMVTLGHFVRHHPYFSPKGTNFNAVQLTLNGLHVRTYERGVEGETLACGTGVTASALAASKQFQLEPPLTVQVRSGDFLQVNFKKDGERFTDVWLSGPADKIFEGTILS